MSERSAAPSADNFLDDDNDDLGMDFDEVPPQSLNEVIEELQPEPDAMDDAFDGDDDEEDSGAAIAPPISEQLARPIGELLSAIALQGISAHAKKRTLSALDDAKIVSMYRRLSSLLETQSDAKEAEAWRGDIRILEAAAAAREINLLALPESETPAAIPETKRPKAETKPALADTAIDAAIERADTIAVVMSLPVTDLAPDPAQARDEGADDELADSIRANGFYPSKAIEVRHHPRAGEFQITTKGEGITHPAYMIVDGERRYRGAVKAGLTHVPVVVTGAAEGEGARLLRQVISNDGKRLKPMEEARTYKRIMSANGWNLQQLADHLGKSKSTVGDRLALADLPEAFRPLFEKGELTAAAAPILRPLQDVPAKILESMIAFAQEGPEWERAVRDGKPVPLKVVENELVEAALNDDDLFELTKGSYVAKHYVGTEFTIGKRHFAADIKQVDRLVAEETKELDAAPKGKASTEKAAPAPKSAPSPYQLEERKRAKAAKAKGLLRRAQLAALSPKLPADLDAKWAGFLVRHLIRETTNDTRREACKLLNIEPPKQGQHSGYSFDKALEKHAATLKGPELVRFALQLLISSDLAVSTYGSSDAKRLTEAAALAKFDLKKVKIDGDREFPAGAVAKAQSAAVKKSAKPSHKAKVRKLNAAFMKEFPLTPTLEAVVGKGPMVRTEITKKIWQYIKRNGLQDKKERRMINADEKLKLVFKGKKQVSMFEMTKLLNKHVIGYKA